VTLFDGLLCRRHQLVAPRPSPSHVRPRIPHGLPFGAALTWPFTRAPRSTEFEQMCGRVKNCAASILTASSEWSKHGCDRQSSGAARCCGTLMHRHAARSLPNDGQSRHPHGAAPTPTSAVEVPSTLTLPDQHSLVRTSPPAPPSVAGRRRPPARVYCDRPLREVIAPHRHRLQMREGVGGTLEFQSLS